MEAVQSNNSKRGVALLVVVVGVIMVLGILVGAGWWYLSSARLPGPALQEGIPGGAKPLAPLSSPAPAASSSGDAMTEKLSSQGTSDAPSAISQDVNATDFTGIDAEMPQISQIAGQ